jgi:hypothetical protein
MLVFGYKVRIVLSDGLRPVRRRKVSSKRDRVMNRALLVECVHVYPGLVVTHMCRLTMVISSRARPSVFSSYNIKPIGNHGEVSMAVEYIF